jgi:hypothetical protein
MTPKYRLHAPAGRRPRGSEKGVRQGACDGQHSGHAVGEDASQRRSDNPASRQADTLSAIVISGDIWSSRDRCGRCSSRAKRAASRKRVRWWLTSSTFSRRRGTIPIWTSSTSPARHLVESDLRLLSSLRINARTGLEIARRGAGEARHGNGRIELARPDARSPAPRAVALRRKREMQSDRRRRRSRSVPPREDPD